MQGGGAGPSKGKPVARREVRVVNASQSDYGKQMKQVVKKGLGATLRMYPSTASFGYVYLDPFTNTQARLPVLPIYATKLVRSTASGQGVLNGTGIGFIGTRPGECVLNDSPCVFYSNDPSSPPFLTDNGATYNIGYTTANHQPFTSAMLASGNENGVAARIVALGLRVRYTGTDLNKAGTWYSGQNNPKLSLDGFGIDDIKKIQGYKEGSFAGRNWIAVTRHITTNTDKEFIQIQDGVFKTVDSQTKTLEENLYMGMIMQGTPGQPFEWEMSCHIEYIGINLDSQAVTKLDTAGTETILSEATKRRHKDNTTKDHLVSGTGQSKPSSIVPFLQKAAKGLLPIVGNLIPGMSSISKMISDMI